MKHHTTIHQGEATQMSLAPAPAAPTRSSSSDSAPAQQPPTTWTAQAHSSKLTPNEEHCEAHFIKTHLRDATGRYVVRLPIVPSPPTLGESKTLALKCLRSMLKRLSNDSKLNQLYTQFMNEYQALGHMRRGPEVQSSSRESPGIVSGDRSYEMTLAHDTSVSGELRVPVEGSSVQANGLPHFFSPHHGVLRERSLTTKLRVVFNRSAQTSSSISLNNVLHTGAQLQVDIFDVLSWIRRHKIIFSSDITTMFRQINVYSADWDLQRILWLDEQNNLDPYQLTTVTYGTGPAVRVLLQLIEDEGMKYHRAIAPMTEGRYVNDVFGGSDTLQEAQLIAQDLIKLCMAGSFPLAKWSSNGPALLQALAIQSLSTAPVQALDDTGLKVLGLSWSPASDQFIFSPESSTLKKLTKRSVLSGVAL
ncbi:uncharacterized protein [Chelonus insularis]|uniref:uncharacterized protein n=1 Tax=Chelonus insularis TaxID=460826 RepID=UPI00158E9F30|nr:uncharacterized protein LOC118069812 [Chelonus insularis]